MHGHWGSSAWALLVILLICGMGFAVTVLLFYMRPQYGAKAFPFLLAFLLGHAALVAVLWRIGSSADRDLEAVFKGLTPGVAWSLLRMLYGTGPG